MRLLTHTQSLSLISTRRMARTRALILILSQSYSYTTNKGISLHKHTSIYSHKKDMYFFKLTLLFTTNTQTNEKQLHISHPAVGNAKLRLRLGHRRGINQLGDAGVVPALLKV